jgi:hypothetical protein
MRFLTSTVVFALGTLVSAQSLPGGTRCGRNTRCAANCYRGEYTVISYFGAPYFACSESDPAGPVYVCATCVPGRGFELPPIEAFGCVADTQMRLPGGGIRCVTSSPENFQSTCVGVRATFTERSDLQTARSACQASAEPSE